MSLLVDVGNTCIKWVHQRGVNAAPMAFAVHKDVVFTKLLESAWGEIEDPGEIWIANVAGKSMARRLTTWCKRRWKQTPQYVSVPNQGFGIEHSYNQPQTLGVDRWLAMVAARELSKNASFIVDCGTAVTIDVVSASGRHMGGLIVPGLAMMQYSLVTGTSDIPPELEGDRGEVALLARGTREAIIGGTLYAVVAVIDRVYADILSEMQGELSAFITGGDAQQVLPLLGQPMQSVPDIVLQGLEIVARGSG